jgi:hypothetical protein
MTAKGWHHDALSAFPSSGFSGSDLASDLGPINRVKEFLRTVLLGCQSAECVPGCLSGLLARTG